MLKVRKGCNDITLLFLFSFLSLFLAHTLKKHMSTGTQQHLPTLDDSEIKRIQRINEGDCGENWVCEYRGQKLVVKYLRGGDKEFWDEVAMWTDVSSLVASLIFQAWT